MELSNYYVDIYIYVDLVYILSINGTINKWNFNDLIATEPWKYRLMINKGNHPL